MPSRTKSHPGSFRPSNDAATYRDLLLFEERLKTNAEGLNRRKRRYQLFLAQLLLTIAFLLCEVLLQTDFLSIPYRYAVQSTLPAIYASTGAELKVPSYLASGLLFVAVTTLVLFFASGTYSEKIGYANRYVPHANRALRNFNMYLNVRQPPLGSKLPFKPLAFLFSRGARSEPSPAPSPSSSRRRSPSPSRSPSAIKRSPSVPIPAIPPASNARGELIFSSRVDRAFRESYERYRAAFERKRQQTAREAYAKTWVGWMHVKMPWMGVRRLPAPAGGLAGVQTPEGGTSRAGSVRGRGAGDTSVSSRRSTPTLPGHSRTSRSTLERDVARGVTPTVEEAP